MILNIIEKKCLYCNHSRLMFDDLSLHFLKAEEVATCFFFEFYGHLERCRELDEMARYYQNKGLEN